MLSRFQLLVLVPMALGLGACVETTVHDPEDHLLIEAEREIHEMN